jgi:hypothetical protein
MMERSNQIRIKVNKIFEVKKGAQKKNQTSLRESLNDVELQVAKMMEINSESDQQVQEMRDHVMELY